MSPHQQEEVLVGQQPVFCKASMSFDSLYEVTTSLSSTSGSSDASSSLCDNDGHTIPSLPGKAVAAAAAVRASKPCSAGDGRSETTIRLALSQGIRRALWRSEDKTAGAASVVEADAHISAATFQEIRTMHLTSTKGVPFTFQVHAPTAYMSLRRAFGIPSDQVFVESLAELEGGELGAGKSGMIFFNTADQLFLVKTVKAFEYKFLRRWLKHYHAYMQVNASSTLLSRFMGFYSIQLAGKPMVHLIVMNNVFKLPEDRTIELRESYDLKGSFATRFVEPEKIVRGQLTVLKETNFCDKHDRLDKKFRHVCAKPGSCRVIELCGAMTKLRLMKVLQQDLNFLRRHNVMDYSMILLIGEDITPAAAAAAATAPASPSPPPPTVYQNVWASYKGGIAGKGNDIYYLGVVDLLQEHDMRKKWAHFRKSFKVDTTMTSNKHPSFYARRLLEWVKIHMV